MLTSKHIKIEKKQQKSNDLTHKLYNRYKRIKTRT